MKERISAQRETDRPAGLHEDGCCRLDELLRYVPMSKSTVWAHVKAGTFPKPFKLSIRVTAWSRKSVAEWLAAREREAAK